MSTFSVISLLGSNGLERPSPLSNLLSVIMALVIVALSFVHLMLAFGKDVAAARISKNMASNLESIGGLMFLSIALLGFLGGSFFLNILPKGTPFNLFSAGIIPLCNIAIGIKVGVGLFAIFLALVIVEKSK